MNGYSAAIDIFIVFMTIQITQAEVTIDVKDFNITNTEATLKNIRAKASITSEDEADEITLAWEDGSRMPKFTYFYTTTSLQDGILLYNILAWNADRTVEDRKQGNGSVLCTVRKDGNPLKSATFTLNVQLGYMLKRIIRCGIIYAQGVHSDDSSIKTAYSDIALTTVWKPRKSSVSLNKIPVVLGEDSSAQLKCQIEEKGNPPGLVRWTKNGNIMNETDYNQDTVTIGVDKETNGDKWQCYYHNVAGDGDISNEVTLVVLWKPEMPSLAVDGATLTAGDTAQVTCQLTDKGNPAGLIWWRKNGETLSRSEFNTEILTFNAAKEYNGDIWQCFYNNTVGDGEFSSVVTMNVYWSPGKAIILVNTEFPKLHDSFTLTCTGDQGNPKGRVAWYLDSLDFTTTTDTTLNISSAAQEHNGDWSCMFYNHLDNGGISNSVRVQVLCLPSLYVEYVSYAFNETYVHFNLRLNDESAAETVNVQVCYTPNDEPLCSTASSKLENKELISDVELPEPSDHTLYNVTFIFSHGTRIVSRHEIAVRGIALRGNEKQSSTSTIFAAVFGALWIITAGIAAVVIVLYHRRLKEKDVNPPKEKEPDVHYANVGAETGTDSVTYNTSATEYEDVAREAAPIRAHNTENPTYMDLDQNDVQQTRNRPAELTVYQSLH